MKTKSTSAKQGMRIGPARKTTRVGAAKKNKAQESQVAPFRAEDLLERVSDGIVAFDARMNYAYVNAKGGELLGRKPKDLIGKNYYMEYPEAKDTPFAKAYARALKTQETIVLEDYYAPFDRWFENRIYPSKNGLTIFFTEITERKKAEQVVRESQERLARIVETIPNGITLVDRNGAIIFANPPAERIFGLSRANITQRTYNDPLWKIAALDGSAFRDEELPFARVKAGRGSVYNVEHAIVYPDRRRVALSINASALVDADGNFDGMVASITDVTERKRMETLIAGEKQVLEMVARDEPLPRILDAIARSIEDQSHGLFCTILLLDSDGVHVRHGAAPSLPKTFVQAIDGQPIGPNAGSCGTAAYRREPVYVSDIASDPLWNDYRELALKHGLRACWSTPILASDGRVFGTFAMYYGEPRSPEQTDLYLIELATHLTEIAIVRKRAQEELQRGERVMRLFVEHSPAAIAMFDREMKYIVASRRYLADYELGEQNLDGRSHYEIFPEMPERWKEIHMRCLAGEIEKAEEDPFPRADGRLDWVRWEIRPWYEADGGIGGVILFSEVITQRKRAEDELRLSRDRLADLSRRLSEIRESEARSIGRELHDQIGQMLTAMKITLDIVVQLPADAAAKKIAQAQELTADLLNRVSALSLELRPPMLDDFGLIPALTWQVNRFQEQSGIAMEFKHSGVEGIRFAPEIETAAYRIVQESLTNVARHARATRVRIEVEERGGWLEIQIEDDGAGFDPESAFAKNRGLSGMRERALLVGGDFQVESEAGKGARKLIRLPAREEVK